MKYLIITSIIIVAVLLTGYIFLQRKNMYIFSELHGKIMMNGIVVENAIIKQSAKVAWNSKLLQQETKSDKNGGFLFSDIIVHDALAQILPHEPEIDQKITIEYEGVNYEAWTNFKYNYFNKSELGGVPDFNLICELTTKPDSFTYEGVGLDKMAYPYIKSSAHGICRFK